MGEGREGIGRGGEGRGWEGSLVKEQEREEKMKEIREARFMQWILCLRVL